MRSNSFFPFPAPGIVPIPQVNRPGQRYDLLSYSLLAKDCQKNSGIEKDPN